MLGIIKEPSIKGAAPALEPRFYAPKLKPYGFQAVSKLLVLDLSCNAASLPEHPAFSCLPQLQELYLRRMQLHEVPPDILSLQQLCILDLSQNSLQLIPEGLLEPNLQALRLDGNPLRSIRRAILDRGTKAVLKYLKDKIPEH